MDKISPQNASKTQRQPYVEVSEVYLYINSFILVNLGLKWIFQTYSIKDLLGHTLSLGHLWVIQVSLTLYSLRVQIGTQGHNFVNIW